MNQRLAEDAPRTAEMLAHLCQAQPERGMQELVAMFEPLIVATTRRIHQTLPHLDADSVGAEVRHEFLLLVTQFDPSRGVPFINYICTMLPQRLQSWASTERRCQSREVSSTAGEEDESGGATSAHSIDCDENTLWLWWEQALADLGPRQAQVMRLVLEGVTEAEIARRMGVAAATVHNSKVSAQKKLQKNW